MSKATSGGVVCVLRRSLSRTLLTVLVLSFAALIALEVYQIILRYVLSKSLPWGRDIAGLLLFTVAWLGLPLLWLERAHLSVKLFSLSAPLEQRVMRWLDGVACLAGLGLTFCIWQAMDSFRFIELTTLGTTAAVRFYPLLAGSVLLALAAALNVLERESP